MGFIAWIIVGGLAGILAKRIMKEEGGLVRNIILGIVGGLVGGSLTELIGGQGITGFNIWSLLVATFGAVVIIWFGRVVSGHKK